MASHLSDIGIEVTKEGFIDEMKALIEKNEEQCKTLNAGEISYWLLAVDGCIELWFYNSKEGISPWCFELHYSGGNTVLELEDVSVVDSFDDGRFGIVNGDCGAYPLNITVPDFALLPEFEEGESYKFQVAAFAESIKIFKDEDDYNEKCLKSKDGKRKTSFGAQCFVPSGSFSPSDDPDFKQSSQAIIHGIVREVELRKNGATGNNYWFALIESYGATFASLIAVEDAPALEAGNVVAGWFHLTGTYVG